MRVVLGFLTLVAGVGAVAAHLAEPSRYQTDLVDLSGNGDRLAGFSAVAEGAAVAGRQQPAVPSNFTTTVTRAPEINETADLAQPVPAASGSNLDAATRDALARDIQAELARLGCYAGPADGVWSASAQQAAGLFVTKANARIPVTEPDFALFSLTKTATADQACGPAVTLAAAPMAPAMGLGGPGADKPARRALPQHVDRGVQSLFTNPLGH
jgi:hypothetical protein